MWLVTYVTFFDIIIMTVIYNIIIIFNLIFKNKIKIENK